MLDDLTGRLHSVCNLFYYGYRRNEWMLDASRWICDFEDQEIDRPIFLLGTHGGGLTLVSRMIRRLEGVVSVSGNHHYWSGADEMHVVLGPMLPFEFSGIRHKVPDHPKFSRHTSWLYATDELIDQYRHTAEDVTPDLRVTLRHTLRWLLQRHAIDPDTARFTDKSQSFTVKVSFLNELLKDTDPRFVLITRNPYAVCYRAPMKAGGMKRIRNEYLFEQLLELAAQHWSNSMESALEDQPDVNHFHTVRFEDILRRPEREMRRICEFADLSFDQDMIPHAHHQVPFGSRFRDRWYPLRPDVNEKYLSEISHEELEIVERYCGSLADRFGYERP